MTDREAARQLVWTIKRAGWTQLRKTADGYLYGRGPHRFLLPYAVAQGKATRAMLQELEDRFMGARAKADADLGLPKYAVEAMPEPVLNPEDLLRDEGGPLVADTGAMNPAGVGSIPAPPATETARLDPVALTDAVEGSSPSGLPTPNAEATVMAKRRKDGKKYPEPWTCDKCGQTFIQKGRHAASCTGKAKPPRRLRAIGPGQVVHLPAPDTLEERLASLESLSKDIAKVVRDLIYERDLYKRERDELAAWKQQLSSIFERPVVPR